MAVAPLAADRRFRAVRDPEVFTAVLRTIPAFAAWLEVMDPISPVFPMAGLHNTLRRLIVDGAPVVTGLHAIGDSVCTTNPTFGRGLSLALCGAATWLAPSANTQKTPSRRRWCSANTSTITSRPTTKIRRPSTRLGWRCCGTPSSAHRLPSRHPRRQPGHVRAATHGSSERPGGIPGVLENPRHDLPARRGLRRPGGRCRHPSGAWRSAPRTADGSARPRSAPRGTVRSATLKRCCPAPWQPARLRQASRRDDPPNVVSWTV